MSLRQNANSSAFGELTEECDDCERETLHEVSIELRTENPEFVTSREPYRVTECRECGEVEEVRMNNV